MPFGEPTNNQQKERFFLPTEDVVKFSIKNTIVHEKEAVLKNSFLFVVGLIYAHLGKKYRNNPDEKEARQNEW